MGLIQLLYLRTGDPGALDPDGGGGGISARNDSGPLGEGISSVLLGGGEGLEEPTTPRWAAPPIR